MKEYILYTQIILKSIIMRYIVQEQIQGLESLQEVIFRFMGIQLEII